MTGALLVFNAMSVIRRHFGKRGLLEFFLLPLPRAGARRILKEKRQKAACHVETSLIRASAILLGISFAGLALDAFAQQLEPRSYSNTPVGMNFLIAGYGHTTGEVAADPSIQLENSSFKSHRAVFGYAHGFDVWGKSGKIDVILPYVWASGSADLNGQFNERSVSGFADPELRFTVNFFGAPALTMEEFADYEQDLIVGTSLQVSPPVGQYDSDNLLNIGTNRWAIKPELGVSKALGPLILELTAGVAFYTDNDDFFGGQTRSQDPLYSVQVHVIYGFRSGIWVALDGTYYTGGQTTIDGVDSNDLQSNSRVGLTAAFPVNRHNSVKLYASSGVSARTGGDFETVGLAWQYRWGGGL